MKVVGAGLGAESSRRKWLKEMWGSGSGGKGEQGDNSKVGIGGQHAAQDSGLGARHYTPTALEGGQAHEED